MKSIALTAVSLSIVLAAPALAAPAATAPAAPAPAQQHRHAKAAMNPNTPEAREMTAALNTLEANGYGDFTNFKADGAKFSATVTQNGKQFTVLVDPTTHQVTRQG